MPIRKTLRWMVLGAAMIAYPAMETPLHAEETVDLAAINDASTSEATPIATKENLDVAQSVVVERYPSGRVKSERQVAMDENGNFVNHGDFRAYSEDGRLIGAGTYRYGKRHGEWAREFHTRDSQLISQVAVEGFVGPFTSTAMFQDDQLHGEWAVTDSKNRPLVLWQFAHNQRQGQSIWFNADGSTRKQLQYDQDQVTGNMIASGSKNELQAVAEFVDGRELVREVSRFTGSRKVKSEGYILKPREVTKTKIDWWNGVIETVVVSREGTRERHGDWQFWHANGNLEMQGRYHYGVQTGRFIWWHENGKKASEGDFVNGRMHGPWMTWYSTGTRKSAGHFVNGERHGEWISWHDNGMPKMQATYESGRLLAEARKWDEAGRLISGSPDLAATETDEPMFDDLRLSNVPDEDAESEDTTSR